MYELGLLKVGLWKDAKTEENLKQLYLGEARGLMEDFISFYPQSIYSEQVKKILKDLPEPAINDK